jgi:hypothetical protein
MTWHWQKKKREQDYVEKRRALQVAVTDREQSLTDQQAYTDIIVRQLEEELQAQQQPQPPIIVHVPATSTTTTNPFAIGSTAPIVPTSGIAASSAAATGLSAQKPSTADGGNPAAAVPIATRSCPWRRPTHKPSRT